MNEKFVDEGYGKRLLGCYAVGVPLAGIGLLLCATIVFSPVGFLFLVAAGVPLYKVQKSHLRRMQEWQDRDRPMPNAAMAPWLMTPVYESGRIEPDA